jgi:predicted P-loop ATPase
MEKPLACFVYTIQDGPLDEERCVVVIPLESPVSREESEQMAALLIARGESEGHAIAPSSREPWRAWSGTTQWSHLVQSDPGYRCLEIDDLVRRDRVVPVAAPRPTAGEITKPVSQKSAVLDRGVADIACAASDDLRKVINKAAFVAGLQIASGKLDEKIVMPTLLKAANDAGFPSSAGQFVIATAIEDAKKAEVTKITAKVEKWDHASLKRTKSGGIDGAQVSNIILILKEHPSWKGVIRYSEFDQRVHFISPPFGGAFYAGPGKKQMWIEDNDMTCVRSWLETSMDVNVAKETVFDAVFAVGKSQSFHQVRDWLEGLTWDGVPRIESWLAAYCGAEIDSESQKIAVPAMSKRWMISAVARAYEPGAKVDCTLVLEGAQSIKKSTTFAILVPQSAWFSDERLNLDSKDTLQQIQGKWLIEIGELASFKGKANEEIKHFLTKRADDFRLPYGRINQPYPRQCVFGGSVNDAEYLSDPTGNRRFFPVRCHGRDDLGGKIDIAGLQAVRDQLWAEAVSHYKKGEQWWLTEEEDEAARVEQEARYAADSWEARVASWVATYDVNGQPIDRFTMDAVLHGAVSIEPAKQGRGEQTRMKNILQRLGFERKQVTIDGKREWRYCRKG